MKTLTTTFTWPDGTTATVTGRYDRAEQEVELELDGTTERLLSAMPWEKQLPTRMSGIDYLSFWPHPLAKASEVSVELSDEGEWALAPDPEAGFYYGHPNKNQTQ